MTGNEIANAVSQTMQELTTLAIIGTIVLFVIGFLIIKIKSR